MEERDTLRGGWGAGGGLVSKRRGFWCPLEDGDPKPPRHKAAETFPLSARLIAGSW